MASRQRPKPLGESDGYVAEEMGECLLALGRTEEARPSFAQAYAKLSQDPGRVVEQPARLERLKHLSEEPRSQHEEG